MPEAEPPPSSTRSARWVSGWAYVVTVAVAIALDWRPADLVWGVWLTGLVGTVFTIAAPWMLLTVRPDLDPTTPPGTSHDGAQWRESMFFLGVLWGSVVMGYGIAALVLVDWIPLPAEITSRGPLVLPQIFGVCFAAYWAMVLVNGPAELWRVWLAIRAGTGSPTNPFVSLGRVLVAGTAMAVLHAFRVDTVAVALVLFLYYIPEDAFARNVLGMD